MDLSGCADDVSVAQDRLLPGAPMVAAAQIRQMAVISRRLNKLCMAAPF
jgi:hypothetical protein